ncbi:hypothetical protein TWF106_008423 [Orbilia oligospora]|uniref:Peptidase S8/S53 domain-containing protein n=1 Tax=Orbilia oligospora TaxID=2813651 RepID=A0A7C8QXV4_ORBOL|nr:hypothetical protein TWF106_008423 [Orbilia oligospora]
MIVFHVFIYLLALHIEWAVAPGSNYNDEYVGNEGVEALGGDIKLWWFLPRTEYMKDEDFLGKFHTELESFAVKQGGGTKHVYRSHSDHIGTLFFTIKIFFTDNPEELWDAYKDNLLSYGEVPYHRHSRIMEHEDFKKAKAKAKLKAKPNTPNPKERRDENMTLLPKSADSVFERAVDINEVEVLEEPFADLQKMSQPKGVPLSELHGHYYRRAAKGQDSTVYVIDSGAWVGENNKHKELSEVRLVDYLFAGPDPGSDMVDSWSEFYHGTKVLSRVAGRRLGTAPLANIVVVQVLNKFQYHTVAHLLDGILRAYDHIVRTKPKFAVLNMSLYFPTGDLSGEYSSGERSIIQKIKKNYDYPDSSPEQEATGVLTTPEAVIRLSRYLASEIDKLGNAKIVTCTNNDKNAPDGVLPANEMLEFPKTVVVVGSTGLDDKAVYQYWDQVRVYAPSSNVMVASFDDVDDSPTILPADGVSFGTGTVSGMLATFVSEGVPIDDAVEHLYKLAHSRKPPGLEDPEGYYTPIAFNGVEKSEWPSTVGDQEGLEEYILP